MSKKEYLSKLRMVWLWLEHAPIRYWRGDWVHKTVSVIIIVVLIITLLIAGIGEWYVSTQSSIPLTYGVSFIPDYAESLGVNPKAAYAALLNIGVRQFRLTSYWSDIEPTKGSYNFSQLDWEFAMANAAHAKIILTVGLRQPRWPECHPPAWVNTAAPLSSWEPELLSFMKAVINRYKNNPALEAWQLENEYFLKGFGDCNNFSRSRLINEYNLLKQLDPHHPIILGRSNNAIGFPINKPTPSIYAISVYKRVWDANVTHRYLEYPYPAWFYSFLAGVQEIYQHKNMIIAEMQAEPWTPDGKTIPEVSLAVQNESLNASRLKNRFSFSKATGMKDVIMWGAEYWYYRKVVLHDPSVWNVAKAEFKKNAGHDGEYLFHHLNL
ncbi:beta-galactosidase [Patescibacteria group bacterium]|nr:beta-galactosidase [Patescibacteria group bacterium]